MSQSLFTELLKYIGKFVSVHVSPKINLRRHLHTPCQDIQKKVYIKKNLSASLVYIFIDNWPILLACSHTFD